MVPFGIKVLLAVVVFVVGKLVVKALLGVAARLLAKSSYDAMLSNFMLAILNAVLTLFVIVAALDQLGVDTTSMVAMLGAAGLAIGLSLQGSLQNFAAGVMLLVFRPFKAGDYVEAGGIAGSVKSIEVFSTTMTTPDNKEIIVPNGSIYGGNIINYSAKATRRVAWCLALATVTICCKLKSC